MPYLDGIEFIYSPDTAGQIEGLQGGALNWVGGLTAEQKQTVEANPSLKVITTNTNYMNALQIRVDQGAGKDLKVRQALWAGTDRQAIIDLVAPGVGVAGNGTFVGPAYEAYYTDEQPAYDPEAAKQMLADAGYADGLEIKLVAQTADPIPAIATAWQAQMKEIGVDVKIQQVPTDVYYADKGTDNWYQADFGIVDWGTRASPITYFKLALTSDAPWNYSRWKNPEFDKIVGRDPAGPRRRRARRPLQAGAGDPAGRGPGDELHHPHRRGRRVVQRRRHRARPRLGAHDVHDGVLHRVTSR